MMILRRSLIFLISMANIWSTIGRIERVDPLAQEPHRPDVVRLAPHGEDVAADVGVGARDRVLDLLERDVVLPAWFKSDVFRVTLRTLIGPALKRVHAS